MVSTDDGPVLDGVLDFDAVEVGDEGPARRHRLTRTDLVRYAGASGDMNPMHHDDVAAVEVGLPSVFGHGMFTMGLLGSAITDWVGLANLRRFQVRFTKQTWPGEVLVTRIVVAAKDEGAEGRTVVLAVSVANDQGEVKVEGEAEAVVPLIVG